MEAIAASTYAFLLVKYLSTLEEPHRFLVLGFEDIRNDLSVHFKDVCKGDFVVPSGKLEDISRFRKNLAPCLIALNWQDLGKYASWTTSFKILDESPLTNRAEPRGVYDPLDVFVWLTESDEAIPEILKFISERIGSNIHSVESVSLRCLLAGFREFIQETRVHPEWFHPRRIAEALVESLQLHNPASRSREEATIGFFLRKIGMEPSSKLDTVPLFADVDVGKTLREYLKQYMKTLQYYLTPSYEKGPGRLRKTLSVLGLNLLRELFLVSAEKELKSEGKKKWAAYLLEFEQGRKEKRRGERKYDVNIFGASVLGRSVVSGLPTHIQFALHRKKDFGGANMLRDLFAGGLKELVAENERNSGDLHFDLAVKSMIGEDDLFLELLMGKQGRVVVDPYIEVSKSPSVRINRLLSRYG